MKFAVGQKIRFAGEHRPRWTIRAMSKRYCIATMPVVNRRTKERSVFYTIIDSETWLRGPNNLIFNPYDYNTESGIAECMRDLEAGVCEVSRRRSLPCEFADEEEIEAVYQ